MGIDANSALLFFAAFIMGSGMGILGNEYVTLKYMCKNHEGYSYESIRKDCKKARRNFFIFFTAAFIMFMYLLFYK